MRNQTCSICGKTFPPRAGRLYCSANCKQIAFNERKRQLASNPKADETKGEPIPQPTHRWVFNLAEYDEINQHLQEFIELSSVEYFFIRKNLRIPFNASIISKFIMEFFEQSSVLTDSEEVKIKQAFQVFQTQYWSGTVQLIQTDFSHIPECYPIDGQPIDYLQSNQIENVTKTSCNEPSCDGFFTELAMNEEENGLEIEEDND